MKRQAEHRDDLSARVDETLYAWLMVTAATAEDPDEMSDFYVGVMAGVARFFWEARHEGITPAQISENVRRTMLQFCEQLQDHERGGRA